MDLQTALIHLKRVRFQLGAPLTLRSRRYHVRGYCGNHLATSTNHERHMTRVFAKALEGRPGAFLDVGTNVGQTFTKILSIDPDRRYLGFDPQLACCFFLERFIRDNHLTQATVMPIALSNVNGILELYSSADHDEMASIEGDVDSMGGKRKMVSLVPARIGDEVLDELRITDVAAIKVDVEGAELQVLEGFKRTLVGHKPALIFEVLPNFFGLSERQMLSPEPSEKNRARANALHALLRRLGYRISQISDLDGSLRPIERFELDDPSPSYLGNNYVAFAR